MLEVWFVRSVEYTWVTRMGRLTGGMGLSTSLGIHYFEEALWYS